MEVNFIFKFNLTKRQMILLLNCKHVGAVVWWSDTVWEAIDKISSWLS